VTSAFMANLIRVGIVIGMWVGIGLMVLYRPSNVVVIAGLCTLFTAGLVAWDARKEWNKYNSNPDRKHNDV